MRTRSATLFQTGQKEIAGFKYGLEAPEINAIVEYLKTLPRPAKRGGATNLKMACGLGQRVFRSFGRRSYENFTWIVAVGRHCDRAGGIGVLFEGSSCRANGALLTGTVSPPRARKWEA